MNISNEHSTDSKVIRFTAFLNKVEGFYLSALRAMALIGATIILGAAAWLAVSGFYKASRDASSVEEEMAVVQTNSITELKENVGENVGGGEKSLVKSDNMKSQLSQFQKRYYGLYKAQFATSLKSDDKPWTATAFNENFFVSAEEWDRLVEKGDINPFASLDDYELLYKGMDQAGKSEVTVKRLAEYKSAKKQDVSRTITEMRTEQYCGYYSDYFESCYSWLTREVPIKRTITEKKLPKGIYSPNDLFSEYHDNFWKELEAQRSKNTAEAELKRSEILSGNSEGEANVMTATQLLAMFGGLMFLFLLIAVERHQRKIAVRLAAE